MVEKKYGRIINVASLVAFQPLVMAVYYATKVYVHSFSEAISNEFENTVVLITALCPGPTESKFQKASSMEESRMVKDKKLPLLLKWRIKISA